MRFTRVMKCVSLLPMQYTRCFTLPNKDVQINFCNVCGVSLAKHCSVPSCYHQPEATINKQMGGAKHPKQPTRTCRDFKVN